jgi:hypothetical protein
LDLSPRWLLDANSGQRIDLVIATKIIRVIFVVCDGIVVHHVGIQ